jgi:surfeit locus 1 family protein
MPTHKLLSPNWLLKHLFALAIFATFVVLGFWQLDRLQQRRESNAVALAVLDQNPTTLTGQEPDPAALAGRKVRVTGSFLNEDSVVLRSQKSDSGVDGVHLLTPLRIAGSDAAVIVDRGWLPSAQRGQALVAYAVEREVTLEGIARAPQIRPDAPLAPRDLPLPGATRIEAWVRVDVAGLQAQIDAPLLPLYVEQLPAPGGSALPRPSDPRTLDEGPHLSYALQWFAFAAMLAVVYAALMRQELQQRDAGTRGGADPSVS